MCLFTRRIFPYISLKPIKVYKVLISKEDKLISPYTKTEYVLNSTIKDTKRKQVGIKDFYVRDFYGEKAIGKGYLHCYLSKRDAFFSPSYSLGFDTYSKGVVVECTIPIFTRYYKDPIINTICSKVLKVGNIIKD